MREISSLEQGQAREKGKLVFVDEQGVINIIEFSLADRIDLFNLQTQRGTVPVISI